MLGRLRNSEVQIWSQASGGQVRPNLITYNAAPRMICHLSS